MRRVCFHGKGQPSSAARSSIDEVSDLMAALLVIKRLVKRKNSSEDERP